MFFNFFLSTNSTIGRPQYHQTFFFALYLSWFCIYASSCVWIQSFQSFQSPLD
jgi:hypothetical protein